MAVVVVESPAKAKTINKYLGSDYTVLASYGHVRDLPPKDGSVEPDAGFDMKWEVAADSRKHVRAIAEALKSDDTLILATDPDREGEAISWHLKEALASSLKKGKTVRRVTFNAITKSAVTEAMSHPRDVDMELVEAYLARRALDYLVGFNLSPVLWRKLPGAKSAGRVQSVCLRLIVERELEIEAFKAREYWTVSATLATPRGQEYQARLTVLGGKKLDRYDLANETAAELAVQAVRSRDLTVKSVEAKPAARNPYPPFMTSTLQQEASRKLGMGAKACMSAAQRLYEAGHITYMRTDGIDMAPEAVMAARDAIKTRFGAEYVPDSPRMYKNKAKNAQEAHECIRPTDMMLSPDKLKAEGEQKKLYDLVWKRTIASQMAAARLERTTVDVGSADGEVELRATGQVILFDGFLKVYDEGRDDDGDEDGARLPQIMRGETADKRAIAPEQHFTQPPPRYTEATLVKRMEELGIGRPSTYASIVTTIQDRDYVRKDKGRLVPEDKGRLVTAFLTNYFRRYVEYDFTAELEEELDEISGGREDYKAVLGRFWRDFSAAIAETARLLRSGDAMLFLGGDALRAQPLAAAHRIAAATGARLMAETFSARMERGHGRFAIDRLPYNIGPGLAALAGVRHLVLVGADDPVAFFAYPGQPGRFAHPETAVTALSRPGEDGADALARLAERLGAPDIAPPMDGPPAPASGAVTQQALGETLAALLPEQAVVVEEGITFAFGLYAPMATAAPHDYLRHVGGAIGVGLPLATGAAVGAPGRRVVSIQADGSALYTVQALWTQARERLDVTTVMLSNRRYAILDHELAAVGAAPGPASRTLFDLGNPDLDWVRIAGGFGVEAARAETMESFADLFAAANRRPGPFLIELVIP